MSTALTAPLNFWDNKSWHYKVHQRLGETLYYFLIRVRPLDMEEATQQLQNMLKEKHLGSVRVFPIFGSYDFMIRAWLPSSLTTEFRTWVDSALSKIAGSHATYPFAVDYIDRRAHNLPVIDRTLLENLDGNAIRAIQTGQDLELLQRCIDGNLVITRRQTNNIGFFTSIYLDDENLPINEGVVEAINQYLEDNPGIINVSIYRGYGFCSVLIKGEVEGFFNIAPMPNHIGKAYKPFGAHTETYLFHRPSHVIGDKTIGAATFYALQGRDLFVQSIIPELYDQHSGKRQIVERLLLTEAHKLNLTQRDKRLLHDYILGFLNDDSTTLATTLFALFFTLEGYLRSHHKEFIGRKGVGSVNEIFERANIPEPDRTRPTLKNLLNVYATTIKISDPTGEYKELLASWDGLTDLRNDLMHAKVDIFTNWDKFITRLIPFLPRIRQLLALIETTTGKTYEGIY
jgi:hypothetical protein